MDDEDTDFPVFKENWTAITMFLRLATQWKSTGFGGVLGLDYCAVESLFRIFNIKKRAEVMDDIQTMEFAALKILNEKANKE